MHVKRESTGLRTISLGHRWVSRRLNLTPEKGHSLEEQGTTLQTLNTDEQVDPARSKQRAKKEAEDSMLLSWRGSLHQPPGSLSHRAGCVLQERGPAPEGQVGVCRHVVFKEKCNGKQGPSSTHKV